jgi:hypothetical protein
VSFKAALLALAALAAWTGSANAQSPAAAAPGGNIDDRVRQQLRVPTPDEREEATLTGDSDIVLTRRTQLFSISGALDVTQTSNAFLAPTDRVADTFSQAQIKMAAGTRIGGRVDAFANLSLVGVRYFDNSALNYTAVAAAIGARTSVGRIAVTASYQPTIVMSANFSSRQLTSHRMQLVAAMPFRWRNVTIEPSIGAERVQANPSDYDAWSGYAGLTASAPLPLRVPLLAYLTAQYQRRSFDSYFSGLVGTARRDNNLAGDVGVVWRTKQWGELRASYGFQQNTSTSDVNAYVAHSGGLGLVATLRF